MVNLFYEVNLWKFVSPSSPSQVDQSGPNMGMSGSHIIDPLHICFRCPICCFVSKPQHIKGQILHLWTLPIKVRGWAKFPIQYLEQSSMFLRLVLDFQYVFNIF